MTLNRAKRLQPVIEMAEKAEREAARQLGQCQGQLAQAEAKLGELQRYMTDYQQQWLSQGSRGVSGQWLMNYQRFLTQLEGAIGQQVRSVAWHRDIVDKARAQWQQRYARLEGLRKLVQRYQDEARLAADKREQRLLDEFAQRLRRPET
ncbi:Flagellar FliJ protein [compost metagenome]